MASTRGHAVRAVVRSPVDFGDGVGVELVICEDLAESCRPEWFAGCTAVVHAAGRAHRAGDRDRRGCFRDNVVAAGRAYLAAHRAGVARFCYLSSIKAQGGRTVRGAPLRPDGPHRPEGIYGRTKHQAELLLRRLAAERETSLTIFRPVMICGPGARANLHALVTAIGRGRALPLGVCRNRRHLVGVSTVAETVLEEAVRTRGGQRIHYLAEEPPLSVRGLVTLLARLVGKRSPTWRVPRPFLRLVGAAIGRGRAVDRLTGNLEVAPSLPHRHLLCDLRALVEERDR